MKKSVVLFNLEQKKYFNYKTGLMTSNHTEASTYIDDSSALRMLDENTSSFKSQGLLTWKLETLINL